MRLFPKRQTELSQRPHLTIHHAASPARPSGPRPAVALVSERRQHRRHDLEHQSLPVLRWDAARPDGMLLGRLVDISAGGVRVRTNDGSVRPDMQIRVRLELPVTCGISPFVDTTAASPAPKQEWVGWLAVCRVTPAPGGAFEIAGRLLDMEDMDRGMLGLYLSTQPLAA